MPVCLSARVQTRVNLIISCEEALPHYTLHVPGKSRKRVCQCYSELSQLVMEEGTAPFTKGPVSGQTSFLESSFLLCPNICSRDESSSLLSFRQAINVSVLQLLQ